MVIVTDPELVDMNFGTGAVKITPAHDPNDYECGKKHNLEFINILTEDGKINENGGEMFKGMHRFECRLQIIEALTNKGLFVKKSANPMRLGKCSRTGDIIEPMLIPQWWVDCKDMARRSVEAVRKGDLKIVPSHHEQTWYNWLENIKDWCVSRQLWWGHRIPAYKVVEPAPSSVEETVWVVGRSKEEAEERAKQKTGAASVKIEQDEDVLDTWFSSGLFPFSVFGWPDQTEELDAFFPTSLLETGHDILFFWVARMVMMSLQLTDRLPFHTVYLHAMVRDRHGRKMSKSLGNVIDPLEVINGIVLDGLLQKLKEGNLPQKEIKAAELLMKDDFPNGIPECGADALRYGLLAYTKQGRSINLDVNRVVAYRFFCNKLWNATRFALMKFPEGFRARGVETAAVCGSSKSEKGVLDWADRWILHRLSACCGATNKAIEEFQFADAVQATYNFWLYEFCDFYLEIIKPVFQTTDTSEAAESRKRGTLEVLYCCLDRGLRLLCPMMPFVTEELYQRLPPSAWKRDSICTADFPLEVVAWTNTRADDEFRLFSAVVKHFRALQVSLDLPPKERPDGIAGHRDPAFRAFLSQRAADISTVSRMGIVRVLWEGGEGEGSMPSEGPGAGADSGELGKCVKDVVSDQCDVFLDCSGMTNLGQTVSRIAKKIETAEKSLASYQKKASIPDYETKVPEDVRQMNAEKMATLTEELAGLRGAKENLDRIIAAAGAGTGAPNGSPA
uniref:valine--tRNA ligase n=1 Tax=Chromera velia CCMP2878 TaxID=1169474 RepID=A0A0G4FFS2_9ALVE|eukprot:Cvel_16754.t1-p1 / transcript=Cvel_16754.t1 / gene=Cvel_16754 / organism=Chromera_velia_CCMP2878 / gene_product=Probable valine--tRNA ligase, cytoplasmic, putative / transcript_product=Probable valine--tRNA ligase, cytoplasmic, putative / location=Cvel_scaffold1306:539-10971(+) / protein_length=732 / sequence_SO=supercontig / SO=protein_coding / is_pseudo=false